MEKFGVISTPVPGGEMKMNLVEIITLKDDDSPAVRSQKSALNMAKMVAAGMLKDQTNGFLGCNGVPVLMDAFAMFEIEDPAAMKRRKKKEKAARQQAAKDAMADFDAVAIKKMKEALAKKAVFAIKKTKITNNTAKPWVEVNEGMPFAHAMVLIDEIGTVAEDTKTAFVKTLSPSNILKFLPTLPEVNAALFTGHMWFPSSDGAPSNVYVTVKFEQCKFEFNKDAGNLVLKLKLFNDTRSVLTEAEAGEMAASSEARCQHQAAQQRTAKFDNCSTPEHADHMAAMAFEQKKALGELLNTVLDRIPQQDSEWGNRMAQVVSIVREMDHGDLQKNADGELEVDFQRLKIPTDTTSVGKLLRLLTMLREGERDSKDSRHGAFIRYLMVGNAAKECFTCGKPAMEAKRSTCKGCHVACFCDRECQKNGWQAHAGHCKVCKQVISMCGLTL